VPWTARPVRRGRRKVLASVVLVKRDLVPGLPLTMALELLSKADQHEK